MRPWRSRPGHYGARPRRRASSKPVFLETARRSWTPTPRSCHRSRCGARSVCSCAGASWRVRYVRPAGHTREAPRSGIGDGVRARRPRPFAAGRPPPSEPVARLAGRASRLGAGWADTSEIHPAERGTQDSNLESPVLETGAFCRFRRLGAALPPAPEGARRPRWRGVGRPALRARRLQRQAPWPSVARVLPAQPLRLPRLRRLGLSGGAGRAGLRGPAGVVALDREVAPDDRRGTTAPAARRLAAAPAALGVLTRSAPAERDGRHPASDFQPSGAVRGSRLAPTQPAGPAAGGLA